MSKKSKRFTCELSEKEIQSARSFFYVLDDIEGTIYLKEFELLSNLNNTLEDIAEELKESLSSISRHLNRINRYLESIRKKLRLKLIA